MLANKIFMSSKTTLRNFNEIISKNVSYDTFKSKKKNGGLYRHSRKDNSGKTLGWGKVDPPV